MSQLRNPHPGEILKEEFLKEIGMSQNQLAHAIGVPGNRIHAIVNGTRNITGDTDLRLCRFFGLSEGYFLRLQNAYDTMEAKRRMEKGSITRFKLNPKRPPKSDWRAFDGMSEEERHRAAASDQDAPPATEAQLARARRVPSVRALRQKLNLTQEQFAARFHLPLGTVRDWEQGGHRPDKAAQVLLTVVAKDPDAVARALES